MINLKLYWSLCCVGDRISYQVVISEPCDLLLDAVFHLSLRWQRGCVVQYLLLLLYVISKQLDLSVEGFKFIFVLPGLSLQLSLQQPERTIMNMLSNYLNGCAVIKQVWLRYKVAQVSKNAPIGCENLVCEIPSESQVCFLTGVW